MVNVRQASPTIAQQIASLYQRESGAVLATLIRLLNGDFDLAEEALQEAFTAALLQWQEEGIPEKPRAWLISTGRFKAIDRLRKHSRLQKYQNETASDLATTVESLESDQLIEDDLLRLIFTCCHPSLAMEARLALTLREVCGLTTEAIAAAFLVPVPTLAQRIVRAKNKIRDAKIPYEIPEQQALAERLSAVLSVCYLLFNEGYSASNGKHIIRSELSNEAIRLTRLVYGLMPDSEVTGLLALMLLHDARRAARVDKNGDLVALEQQDRALWCRAQIDEGGQLVVKALSVANPGVYSLQAAIAAVHDEAPTFEDTDWAEITGLYQALLAINPSPVYGLNHAVALAMRDGPEAGLAAIAAIAQHQALKNYYLLYAAKADLYRKLGKTQDALIAYQTALDLTEQEPEQRFIEKRIAEL
ncbi:DNA-directed RNA polymerase sigma-70 factor [Thalassotalea insulae]|uniref:DNA-directed RNA polymerase sigma-70 factor n=2 Tax=Thalassotalea insulae TaxID=2056778 RepID=A0ABQ6GT02_9GAMM|nr:DNA-directed RNA polymerase sigma-70 factor [Thalassotalea insulae]